MDQSGLRQSGLFGPDADNEFDLSSNTENEEKVLLTNCLFCAAEDLYGLIRMKTSTAECYVFILFLG